jgi:hypothetical protein
MDQIKSAAWVVSKTEAIDPASDFWWVDDDPTTSDREWLRFHGREDRLIQISSDGDPSILAVARAILKRAISLTIRIAPKMTDRMQEACRSGPDTIIWDSPNS